MPAAMKPAARRRTWPAKAPQLTCVQVPFTLRLRPTWSGHLLSFLKRSSVTLSPGSTRYEAGTENSRIGASWYSVLLPDPDARYGRFRPDRAEGPDRNVPAAWPFIPDAGRDHGRGHRRRYRVLRRVGTKDPRLGRVPSSSSVV